MKKYLLVLVLLVIFSCKNETKDNLGVTSNEIDPVYPELKVVDYYGLKPLLHKDDGKIYVINFWATWCAPCIKELPYFEKLNKEYSNKNVEVILISLDFPKKYESVLKPFIKKHDLKSEVYAFDDTNSNYWIPQVYSYWSGAIPATLIYNNKDRKFYEQSFNYEELENEVIKFLKNRL